MMNPMLLSNIRTKDSDCVKSDCFIPAPLKDVVYSLATTNPKWELVGESMGYEKNKIDRFHIYSEEQRIGGLKHDWSNRSGQYAVLVQAESIGNRKDHIVTSDPKKAIREAQKHFTPKSTARIMSEHMDRAKRVVENQRYRKNQRVQDYMGNLREHIQRFALSVHREAFNAYIESAGKRADLDSYEGVRNELNVLENIGTKIKNNGVYIAIHKGGYLVKALDNVQHYTDTTLPDEYRGKLGMLKLVEPEQCIEDVGCRATDDVYVLIA